MRKSKKSALSVRSLRYFSLKVPYLLNKKIKNLLLVNSGLSAESVNLVRTNSEIRNSNLFRISFDYLWRDRLDGFKFFAQVTRREKWTRLTTVRTPS
jgi:hypothetical protein